MENFKEIACGVLSHDAAIQCQNKDDLVNTMLSLYQQPDYRQALAEKGKAFVRYNQGAITRICTMLEQSL